MHLDMLYISLYILIVCSLPSHIHSVCTCAQSRQRAQPGILPTNSFHSHFIKILKVLWQCFTSVVGWLYRNNNNPLFSNIKSMLLLEGLCLLLCKDIFFSVVFVSHWYHVFLGGIHSSNRNTTSGLHGNQPYTWTKWKSLLEVKWEDVRQYISRCVRSWIPAKENRHHSPAHYMIWTLN